MSPADLNLMLLVAMLVLLGAAAAVRLSVKLGLPSLLAYLAIGLLIGEAGLGLRFDDAELTQTLGLIALAVILAEGGLTTRWPVIRPVVGRAVVLATLGVLVSVTIVAAIAHLLLGFELRTAILIGAAVGSTDAAAVFSVLRRLPIRPRLRATLEAESGFNDPPVIILVSIVVSDSWTETNVWVAAVQVGYQLIAGVIVGLVLGRLGQWLLSRSALPAAGLYPIATLAIAILAYATAGVAGASGFLAAYVAGLWLGNARLPHRNAALGFAEGAAWLAQIGLFVLLGLLASPERLPNVLVPALIIGTVLLLVARPVSVFLSSLWFRVPLREQAFMSWAGLRGAVPIVVSTIPLSAGLSGAVAVFDIVFVLVVLFTLIQGPTLPWLARRLGVTETAETHDLHVESAPLEEVRADLLHVTVAAGSKLVGLHLDELRLPHGAAVTLVAREGKTFVPDEHTAFRPNDRLLVVTTDELQAEVTGRLRVVSRYGKLARWLGARNERPVATSAARAVRDRHGSQRRDG